MTSISIVHRFAHLKQWASHQFPVLNDHDWLEPRPDLHHLAQNEAQLPRFVRDSAVAMRYLHLLGPLAWDSFPERDLERNYGIPAVPYAPFVAACLVKLDLGLRYMSQSRHYLLQHPALVWVLGFPLTPSSDLPSDVDLQTCLPTHRHFTRMLRQLPNSALQYLLDSSVQCLRAALPPDVPFGHCISLDTKHILAWVKENNPKAYVKHRFDKDHQPAGDPDCRLGCKRRRNQRASSKEPPPTPTDNPVPANTISVGEFYWGYGSGVVATKVPGWGEFVLAELTLPFDQPDVAYFHPLMADAERRLGFRPRYGAFDAAFDAFYIYEYFYRDDQPWDAGFAAVPLSRRGGQRRQFDPQGLPLCQAGLPMPLKYTFTCHTTRFEHERGRHVCPLRFPEVIADACPVDHKNWPKGGCVSTLPTSIGARIRYQLDRDSDIFKEVYKQRTATERINAQATELGIERPRLRNQQAIANQNTLIYILINLRALQRVCQKRAEQADSSQSVHTGA
jgi:hypothetical protein